MHNKCRLVWCTHHWWSRHLLQSGDVEALPICTVFSSVPSNIDILIFSGSGAIELPVWEKMWPFGKHWELWSQISSYRYLRNEFEWYDINMSINQLVAFFVLKKLISIFTLDETLRQVPSSGERDVNEAVGQAREGFRSWSKLSGFERGNVLKRAANIMRVRSTTAQLLLDVLPCYLNYVIYAA